MSYNVLDLRTSDVDRIFRRGWRRWIPINFDSWIFLAMFLAVVFVTTVIW